MKNSNVLMNRVICGFWVFTIVAVSTLKVTYPDTVEVEHVGMADKSALMNGADPSMNH